MESKRAALWGGVAPDGGLGAGLGAGYEGLGCNAAAQGFGIGEAGDGVGAGFV